LADEQVNLIAFNAFPVGRERTQLVIYPLNPIWLGTFARHEGLQLQGPHHAFIVQGDDNLGALLSIHQKLCDAEINVSSSNGITDGSGGYRYILHVHPEDYERAKAALGVDRSAKPASHLDIKRHCEKKM
jgi:hypothetical protein